MEVLSLWEEVFREEAQTEGVEAFKDGTTPLPTPGYCTWSPTLLSGLVSAAQEDHRLCGGVRAVKG